MRRHHCEAGSPQTCRRVVVETWVGGVKRDVAGVLCWRGTARGKTLQVLTSGYTYGGVYWDWPHESETYSYVEAATAAGYVTLAYDRLGTGDSDSPHADVAGQADVLHRLVRAARAGWFGVRFRRVVSVGHSLGSAIAIYEAGTYRDVDALVLTGNMRATQPDFTGVPSHRVVDDPKFTGSELPSDVLTTAPGAREVFYSGDFDPMVAYVDEGLKETGVLAEVLSIPTAYAPEVAGRVDAPVLIVVGQRDFLFCDAGSYPCDTPADVLERQATMLPSAPRVDAVVIANAGHSLNLHRGAPEMFAAVNDWARKR